MKPRIRVGDKVTFNDTYLYGSETTIKWNPNNEEGFDELRLHGSLHWDGKPGKVVKIFKGCCIVNFCSKSGEMQLEFKPECLVLCRPQEKLIGGFLWE